MSVLGLDTSNYTTSVAVFDGRTGQNEGHLLEVRPGELGLRQSDALFQLIQQRLYAPVKADMGLPAFAEHAGVTA